jgi:hypothetical protein
MQARLTSLFDLIATTTNGLARTAIRAVVRREFPCLCRTPAAGTGTVSCAVGAAARITPRDRLSGTLVSLSGGARMTRSALAFCLLAVVASPQPACAAVKVIVGSTPIVDGEATAAHDITVFNEHLAFALAVESPAPYGVPRGAIVDVATVVDGKPGRDRVVFADFIPNNWSAWPSTYQKVDILERGPDRVVVRAARDWGKVAIETTYALRAGSDRVEIRTTMTNKGDTRLADLLSGQTLWPERRLFLRRSRSRRPQGRRGDGRAGGSRRGLRRGLDHHAACALPRLRRLRVGGHAQATHAGARRHADLRCVAAGRDAGRPRSDAGGRDRAQATRSGDRARRRDVTGRQARQRAGRRDSQARGTVCVGCRPRRPLRSPIANR